MYRFSIQHRCTMFQGIFSLATFLLSRVLSPSLFLCTATRPPPLPCHYRLLLFPVCSFLAQRLVVVVYTVHTALLYQVSLEVKKFIFQRYMSTALRYVPCKQLWVCVRAFAWMSERTAVCASAYIYEWQSVYNKIELISWYYIICKIEKNVKLNLLLNI